MSNFYDDFEAYVKGQDSSITELVITDEKADAAQRMDIYKNAYSMRLLDILYADFPTIYEILGTESFFAMGTEYLAKYPSTSFTVRHFGKNLAKFLHEEPPYADYPYLWQIADFEWAKGTVFDAPDTPLLDIEQLATIAPEAWENLTFEFIPAMTRLLYDYNVPQIWQSVNNGEQNSEPVILPQPMPWVMWRKNLNPNWYSMTEDEDWFFIHARKGMPFGELCEGLSRWIDEDAIAPRAAEFVRRWIDEKMLKGVNTG